MSRITNKNAMILFYSPARETCLGLIIPGEKTEIPVSSMDISFSLGGDVKYASLAEVTEGLPDASGEFTGYYEKDGCDHGADSDSPSGS